jgi:hypothetical protein
MLGGILKRHWLPAERAEAQVVPLLQPFEAAGAAKLAPVSPME